jgi:REP element-mobilizing transposase RayT
MPYNPAIHHRRSIRLKGYDYSQAGLYFVTICVQHKICLFGEIVDGEMILNDTGMMIEKWWMELPHKFPDIALDTYVIMPNHFHGIIVNTGNGGGANGDGGNVGADLRVCPDTTNKHKGGNVGADLRVCPDTTNKRKGEHIGSPLHAAIQWFKTMTTNEYMRGVKTLGWEPFDKKLWQRNYYDHIIHNEQSYQNISQYIINNPANWGNDRLYEK